jgi:hypothetical protein
MNMDMDMDMDNHMATDKDMDTGGTERIKVNTIFFYIHFFSKQIFSKQIPSAKIHYPGIVSLGSSDRTCSVQPEHVRLDPAARLISPGSSVRTHLQTRTHRSRSTSQGLPPKVTTGPVPIS